MPLRNETYVNTLVYNIIIWHAQVSMLTCVLQVGCLIMHGLNLNVCAYIKAYIERYASTHDVYNT
jgi:hypothetical protein